MPHPYSSAPLRTSRWKLLPALLGVTLTAFGQTSGFAPVVPYASGPTGALPYNLAVADVNGDGQLDVVTANSGTSTLGVLLGNGRGGFVLQATSPSTGPNSGPYNVVLADVNGDGKPDALTSNFNKGTLGVLLGNGSGGFTLLPNSPATVTDASGPSNFVTAADVNGDGKLDVLASNVNTSTLGVLLGDGAGGFTLQPNSPPTGATNSTPFQAVVADVNGDSKPDVVVVNYIANTLGVLLGNGRGGFTLQAPLSSTGANSSPVTLAVVDINGDGKLDALTVNSRSSTLGVLLGNGSGGFTLQANSPSTGTDSSPYGLAVADLNGDGKLDVLTGNTQTNTLGILLGNGNGGFTLQPNAPSTGLSSGPRGVVVTDVNGDGKPDALVANAGANTLGVLLNGTALAARAALPSTSATLSPNPARGSTLLHVTGLPADGRTVTATLLNAVGQVVRRLSVPAALGTAQGSLSTAGVAPGLYLLHAQVLSAQGVTLGCLATQRLSIE